MSIRGIGYIACTGFGATACKPASGTGSCNNLAAGKARTDYSPCNFADISAVLKRAIWNHNLIVRDGSFGIHNAGYTIQVLQGTYKALGLLLESKSAANAAYNASGNYPNATLR